MNINKLSNTLQNPKTGKKYSSFFKRRTIEYLLSGMYDEQTIWEKFQINSTLLLEWRKWFYKHFEAKNYSTSNYGKKLPTIIDGQIATEADQIAQRATEGLSERAKQRKAEEALFRAYHEKHGGKTSHKTKKKWWKQVQELRKEFPETSLKNLCALYRKSTQAWYQATKRERINNRHAKLIEKEVLKIRIDQPRIGGKKLYHLLKPFLIANGIKQGRHKFLDTLRSRNLMIKKKKHKRKTTNSNHHYRKYPNKAKDIKVYKANQLWVSDITYIAFGRTFYYLSLVQDAYSRKIVGWNLSTGLKADGAIAALKMAVATLPRGHKGLMHHSDRGLQYCCKAYIKILKKKKIKISMTQYGDPYENILAERINKTMKEEFLDVFLFLNFKEAKYYTAKAIRTYNRKRPHASLNYFTPNQAHYLNGSLKKLWKNNKKYNNKKRAVKKK